MAGIDSEGLDIRADAALHRISLPAAILEPDTAQKVLTRLARSNTLGMAG
jgi:hypothetical protein